MKLNTMLKSVAIKNAIKQTREKDEKFFKIKKLVETFIDILIVSTIRYLKK